MPFRSTMKPLAITSPAPCSSPLWTWSSFPPTRSKPRRSVEFWQLTLINSAPSKVPAPVSDDPANMVVFCFVDDWPTEKSRSVELLCSKKPPPVESPPPPTFCEIHVGAEIRDCAECVPGLFVCPAHVVACGGEALICCFFCWRVLCNRHAHCPCADAIGRRRDVAMAKKYGTEKKNRSWCSGFLS